MQLLRKALIVALVSFAGACSKSEPPAPAQVSTSTAKDPATARTMIASSSVVIDVRTPDEFAEGHLPNAVNIPVQEFSSHLDDVGKLVAQDKTRPIVVYCAAGKRAAKAKAQLDKAGYTHVVNGGGLDDLR